MGTMSAPPKPEIRVVLTAYGRAITPKGTLTKVKAILLEDKRVVLISYNGRFIVRDFYDLESASFRRENAAFITTDGYTIHFNRAPCSCGMGNIVAAGVTEDGREILTQVRPPDWVTGL